MHPSQRPKRTSFTKGPDLTGKLDTLAFLRGEKKTPTEADYRQAPVDSKARCHECQSYQKPGQSESDCAKVVGVVRAEGTCDLFSERTTPVPSETRSTEITIRLG